MELRNDSRIVCERGTAVAVEFLPGAWEFECFDGSGRRLGMLTLRQARQVLGRVVRVEVVAGFEKPRSVPRAPG